MLDRRSMTSGMTVRGGGGERLGYLAGCGQTHFQVDVARFGHGHVFYLVPYGTVRAIRDGEVHVSVGAGALKQGHLRQLGEIVTYVQPVASLQQLHGWDPTREAVEAPYQASGPHEGPGSGH
jgi:hypothetical protein